MLEKLFDYTPEELGHILSLETMNLLGDKFTGEQQDEAIDAAFVLVAHELSEVPLSEDETEEAVDKVRLYVMTNDIKVN